jgi:hypothetical protein
MHKNEKNTPVPQKKKKRYSYLLNTYYVLGTTISALLGHLISSPRHSMSAFIFDLMKLTHKRINHSLKPNSKELELGF